MENRREPIPVGGQWSSGDASIIPDGYCLVCRNMLPRPGRIDSRPPLVYDSLMTIRGLFNFDDQTNKVSRLMALNSTPNLFMKGTSGETWSSSLGTAGGTRITSSTNYRGKAYYAMDNGSGVPTAINSFDGTNLSSSPFNSSVFGRCVNAYLDRLFIAYPRVTVTDVGDTDLRYFDTSVWTVSTANTLRSIVSGTTTVKRVFPDATNYYITNSGIIDFAGSSTDLHAVVRQDFRGVDHSSETTIRADFFVAPEPLTTATLTRNTAVTVGHLVLEMVSGSGPSGVGRLLRCSTAGTTAVAAPAWNLDLGETTTDGTAVWMTVSDWKISSQTITVPSAADNPDFVTEHFPVKIPWRTNTAGLYVAYTFTDASPKPVDVALTDGVADGSPLKKCFGFQVTAGDFYYPFINTDSSETATVDLDEVIWTEVLDVKQLIASQFYRLHEVPGLPTAAATVAGRYIVHKRNGFWVFNGNQDLSRADVIPIRRERIYKGVGCIGPRAHDNLNDVHFFIGEDDVYSFTVGGEPVGLGGDAMREEIMDRGSNWVESQSTYNMPLLKVDQRQKEVWVYTQKGKLYSYNIDRKAWSAHDTTAADGTTREIADIAFNPNTRKMYVAVGGYGLARLDWSASPAKDIIDNTATEYNVTCDLVAKPLELYPDRVDTVVDHFGVHHLATASQTGQRHIAYVSTDRGETFDWSNEVLFDITEPRNEIPLFESGPSVTLKISSIGKTGPTIWSISKLDAEVIVLGGEWPQVKPTAVSASL